MRYSLLTLLLLPAAVRADDVTITKAKDAIEFKAGPQVVAKYHVGEAVAKPFLHPVLAPGGVPVTRGWPVDKTRKEDTTDHVHQKSAWFCHGDVIPEGVELKVKTTERGGKGVDFWSEARDKDGVARHGRMACVTVGEPQKHSATHWSVLTKNEWKSPDATKILDEDRTIHFHDLPEGRLFAFEITLRATVCPVTFGDTKEGSFGVRVHDAIRVQANGGGVLANADGKACVDAKTEALVWGRLSDWCDYHGTVDGKHVGVAVFDHPSNAARAAWHARAYGLMAANPFGRTAAGFPSQKGKTDLVKIEKGGELKLKYAIYAHAGDTKAGKVAEAYEAFKK
jgi:hypothetical protein